MRASKFAKLLKLAREHCASRAREGRLWVTAEEIVTYGFKKADVTRAFQKLIEEGVIGHKVLSRTWDRDWTPSIFTILVEGTLGPEVEPKGSEYLGPDD